VCREHRWGFCFIGGLAVIRWGEPRLTRDIDLTILAGFGSEEPVIDGLLGRFPARLEDARQFAVRNRVVLLTASNGIPVDVAAARPLPSGNGSPWPGRTRAGARAATRCSESR